MIYYKIINGQRKLCPENGTIRMPDGTWKSRPSAEQFAAAGWEVFVPPVTPASPQTEPGYEDVINAVKKMLASDTSSLSDEDALAVAALFPTWASKLPHDGQPAQPVIADERLWFDGKLYKVLQPHTPQADWTPDAVPALFVEVSVDEWPPIPETITAENKYMAGDKGTWKGQHYLCVLNDTVWNPDVYPAAWQLQP